MANYNQYAENGSISSNLYSSPSGSYSGGSLPMYQSNKSIKKKSKCPRGAVLGEISSCCGLDCTRACALSEN